MIDESDKEFNNALDCVIESAREMVRVLKEHGLTHVQSGPAIYAVVEAVNNLEEAERHVKLQEYRKTLKDMGAL